jgi:hypothetical protein
MTQRIAIPELPREILRRTSRRLGIRDLSQKFSADIPLRGVSLTLDKSQSKRTPSPAVTALLPGLKLWPALMQTLQNME